MNSAASAAHAINFNVGNAEVEFDGIVGGADNGDLGAIGITGNLDLDANIVGAASLAVSGTSNLGANVTTSGNQTYTGDITLSADVGLNTSGGDVQIDGDVNTALVSGGSESGIIQFLGNGSYQYSADGGSIYTTATATSSATTLGTGSLTYSGGSYSWTTPSGVTSTKLLVVGGGGSGGSSFAGAGGGAGGYVYHESYSLSLASNYSIAVGDGGTAASTHETAGRNGSSSVFGTVVAYGGGGGGTAFGVVPPLCPAGGCGSSGGAGWNVDSSNIRSASQGNIGSAYQPSSHGCSGSTCNGNSGGAGGGAGAPGQLNGSAVALTSNSNAPAGYYSTAPTGGVGLANDITGSSTYYAGGGGSGSDGLGGNGGLGGGGNGGSGVAAPSGYQLTDGLDGAANTGGGGGGGGGNSTTPRGGDGGSGIVVVNYDYDVPSYAEYDLSINTGAGDIDVNGALANLDELNLTSTSAGSEISGIISTNTIVNKTGAGTLTLSGTNTYTGDTTISAGTLKRDRHLSRYYRCKCCIRSHLRCGSNRYHSITIRCRYH